MKHRYKILCKHDGGYLGIRADNAKYIEELKRVQTVIKLLDRKRVKTSITFDGLARLVYCMRVNLVGIRSFRQFFRLYTDLTGDNSLSYWRRGRQITSSEFEWSGGKFCYCGDSHQGYIDADLTVEYLTSS